MISGQTWSKFSKKIKFDVNYEKYCFVRVLTLFDLRSNLGLTRGILVILAEKGTSGALVPERVVPRHSGCSRGPMEKKNDIFGFSVVWHTN